MLDGSSTGSFEHMEYQQVTGRGGEERSQRVNEPVKSGQEGFPWWRSG